MYLLEISLGSFSILLAEKGKWQKIRFFCIIPITVLDETGISILFLINYRMSMRIKKIYILLAIYLKIPFFLAKKVNGENLVLTL